MAVAVNCFVLPTGMFEAAGVTAMETTVAPVTVREAVPLTLPELAVMVALPAPIAVAMPLELTVATPVELEDQLTEVSNCVLPSSKLPTALNCCAVPSAIDAVAGLMEIEVSCAGTTVRVAVSESEPTCAVMVVLPAPAVVARPELLMVATASEEELQVTPLTRSCEDPSL